MLVLSQVDAKIWIDNYAVTTGTEWVLHDKYEGAAADLEHEPKSRSKLISTSRFYCSRGQPQALMARKMKGM